MNKKMNPSPVCMCEELIETICIEDGVHLCACIGIGIKHLVIAALLCPVKCDVGLLKPCRFDNDNEKVNKTG
ncbi:hypothetical protein SAMN02745945_01495 [Peptoclostridium litorale DSM 5388]|uniref:Uncharacterized protein n=1 Tax=Peptoclostridium litorale DSM 5388 TaxID=1121324 RepID=A0A069RF44_PEPLI|nr:hypothetical protein [Peptoclostridium litorale]KDR95644.1 hypothetical protein CLIT_10c03710 [Peptoclostridium litorale DSM 5388]SIO00114.1 hypothetical protein SAMN02745945_01495 [Peptoclostridium litorale DSM 5388]